MASFKLLFSHLLLLTIPPLPPLLTIPPPPLPLSPSQCGDVRLGCDDAEEKGGHGQSTSETEEGHRHHGRGRPHHGYDQGDEAGRPGDHNQDTVLGQGRCVSWCFFAGGQAVEPGEAASTEETQDAANCYVEPQKVRESSCAVSVGFYVRGSFST